MASISANAFKLWPNSYIKETFAVHELLLPELSCHLCVLRQMLRPPLNCWRDFISLCNTEIVLHRCNSIFQYIFSFKHNRNVWASQPFPVGGCFNLCELIRTFGLTTSFANLLSGVSDILGFLSDMMLALPVTWLLFLSWCQRMGWRRCFYSPLPPLAL